MCCLNVSVITNTSFTVYGTYIVVNSSGTNTAVAKMGGDTIMWTAVGQQ
jgi:hypothetical protein